MIRGCVGFTLLELLVAAAVFCILMVVVFSIINMTSSIWTDTNEKIDSFQSARAAFESMTRKISQATLNIRYDYFDASGRSLTQSGSNAAFTPTTYGRQSELQFVVGKDLLPGQQISHAIFFQAPLGQAGATYTSLKSLLNGCGYYVRFGSDADDSSLSARPPFITDDISPPQFRYQLMEFSQPSESLEIYDTAFSGNAWFTAPLLLPPAGSRPPVRILAENVVAFVLLPKVPPWEGDAAYLAEDYEYDSRKPWKSGNKPVNQICPILEIVMVVIDKNSAQRIQGTSSTPPDLGYDPASVFKKAALLESDLKTVEEGLRRKRIKYRVFRTEITLSHDKWTKN